MQEEISEKDESLKNITKLLQNLIQDLNKEEVEQMVKEVKREKGW